jgi:hypothetical protein
MGIAQAVDGDCIFTDAFGGNGEHGIDRGIAIGVVDGSDLNIQYLGLPQDGSGETG